MRDSDSESAKNFPGLKFFPVNPSYRVVADFVPYEPKKKIMVPDDIKGMKIRPAHATIDFSAKLARWTALREILEQDGAS